MAHTCKPSTQEVEVGGARVQGQFRKAEEGKQRIKEKGRKSTRQGHSLSVLADWVERWLSGYGH